MAPMPAAMTARTTSGDADDPLRVGGHAVTDPAPQRVAVHEGRLALMRDLGPEDPAVEDDKGCG